VKKLATIDVGPSVNIKEVSKRGFLMMLVYQLLLAFSWFLPSFIGKRIGLFFVNFFSAPGRKYGYQYSNYCHWVYVSFWMSLFAKWRKEMKGYCPKCPAFFAYSRSRFGLRFFSSAFLKRYREAGYMEKEYEADHWVQYKAKSEEYNKDLLKFLSDV